MEFTHLRHLVREAARQAFTELRAAHPSERFYVFALYTDEGVMTLLPAANSEEAWQQKVAASKAVAPTEANYYRWASGEWSYESWGDAHFQEAQRYLTGPTREDNDPLIENENTENEATENEDEADELKFTAFQEQVLAMMTGALHDLDAEGFFGSGEARQQVTLFITMSDADEDLRIEDTSASVLNPPAVFERFAARHT